MEETLAWRLGRFGSDLRFDDLPVEVVERTKLSVIDALANALAGWDVETSNIAISLVKGLRRQDARSTVWREGFKAHPMDCVLANSVMVHSLLKDDSLPGSRTHPGSMVVPTALAMAEECGGRGSDVMVAIVLGYELIGRLSAGYKVSTPIVDRGHRGSPVFGPFGAAAAAAKIMGLEAERFKNAIAFAAHLASGLLEPTNAGTQEFRFQNAAAARNGILAAFFARQGLKVADATLDGQYGFLRVLAGLKETPEEILANLGTRYEISRSTHKPYPTCGNNEMAIQITEDIIRRHPVPAEQVEEVRVVVHPQRAEYPGCEYAGPFRTVEQALFSKPFAIASVLAKGRLEIATYGDLSNAALTQLAQRVRVEGDREKGLGDCVVVITLKEGTVLHGDASVIKHPPFDRNAAVDDFILMTGHAIRRERQERVLEQILHLEELEDVTRLTSLLVKT